MTACQGHGHLSPDVAAEVFTVTGAEICAELLRAQADVLAGLLAEAEDRPDLTHDEWCVALADAIVELERRADEGDL